jgi:hypothetical protein
MMPFWVAITLNVGANISEKSVPGQFLENLSHNGKARSYLHSRNLLKTKDIQTGMPIVLMLIVHNKQN